MSQILKDLLRGMGSLVDLKGDGLIVESPKIHTIRIGTPEDDAKALRGDMEKVGKDMGKAMISHRVKRQKEIVSHGSHR